MDETMGLHPYSVWDMPDGLLTPDGRLPCTFSNWLLGGGELTTGVQWGPIGDQHVKLSHSLDDCRACRHTLKEIAHALSFGREFYLDMGFAVMRVDPGGEVYMVDPRQIPGNFR